ncbi:oxaloacetate decarboxylase gamma chain [Allocatenococcus thiocycli]|nr:oxaloacetate decarboxylase gamma chain [Catenococcus thiocycli]
MEVNLFTEGLNLMTLGMGFVFTFLVFLVFAVKAMSNFLVRFETTTSPQPKNVAPTPKTDHHLVAVIAAAIHHKKVQQRSL